jgi:hypothetical protein
MNSDGRSDLLLINPGDSEFRVSRVLLHGEIYRQRADGTLPGESERIGMVGRSTGFDLVDMDRDGRLDLVTVSDARDGTLGLHFQRDGNLGSAREFSMPFTFGQLLNPPDFNRDSHAFGDFNGDGVQDVVYSGGYGPFVMMAGKLQPSSMAVRPPGAPRAVAATGASDSTDVRVSFLPPSDPGGSPITHYETLSSPDPGTRDVAFGSDPLQLSRTIVGQRNGKRYRYRVRAYNAAGPGAWSEYSPEFEIRRLPFLTVVTNRVFEPKAGMGSYRFKFELSEPALEGGVTFDIATRDGTAKAGADYQAVVRTGVHMPAGTSALFLEVPILADSLTEGQEFFELVVSNVAEARHQGQRAIAEIFDPMGLPSTPSVQVLSPSVIEGNTGVTVMTFPVLMSSVSAADVSFDVRTINGSARAGEDYVARSDRFVIPAGTNSGSISVLLLPDVLDEPDESLTLFLDRTDGANLGSPSVTGTILDDDRSQPGIPAVVEAESEKGFHDLEFMYISTPDARLSATAMVKPVSRRTLLGEDPTPSTAFDSLDNGVTWATVPVPANPTPAAVEVRLLAVAQSTTARRIALFVGSGAVPSAESNLCAKQADANSQACELVLRREPGAPESVYWVLVQNALGSGTSVDSVEMESAAVAMVAVNRELVFSGPSDLSGAAFIGRAGWDIPSLLPGERRLGYLLVESAPGAVLYNEPFRLHRTGTIDAPHVLVPGERRSVSLAGGDAQERIVFDVPENAAAVTFTLEGSGEVSLYASHDPAPSMPAISSAPPRHQADAVSSRPGASQAIVLSGASLKKGRWHVTPVNRSGSPASVTVRADVSRQGSRPAFRPGHYFNPERPGHGLFLDFAGDQWVMVWYTYLQDGTPTWYYTQGAAPSGDNAQWPVDLYRVSRGRDNTRAVRVGTASLTVLEGPAGASPKLSFGYNLDGDAGWETLSRLGDDACPSYSGQALDSTGHWYAPADPGYGFSVQILPNTEVYAAYVYDAPGFPRWLIGQKDFDASIDTVTMQQIRGFCPTCPLVPLQSKSIATLNRTLGAMSSNDGRAGITSLEMYVTFEKPLPATPFSARAPVYLLSARKGCQ